MTRSLISDGAWVAITQVLSAIGTLVGVRLLTEVLAPDQFGLLSLWVGVTALLSSGLANPTMQALLRFYPEYSQSGHNHSVRVVARNQLLQLATFAAPILFLVLFICRNQQWMSLQAVFLATVIVIVDIVKMQDLAILNAMRSQRAYGIWQILDNWGRPLAAYFAITAFEANFLIVLSAYGLAGIIIWMIMRRQVPTSGSRLTTDGENDLQAAFWKYTLPLLPLGLVGWAAGMGDRYLIADMMTIADVGVYAAVYGLASRPVLMMAGIVETTLRPVYHLSVVNCDISRQANLLKMWLLLLLAGGAVGAVLAFSLHGWLVRFFLGESYWSGSYLIPWLVIGHLLLVISQMFIRIQYAAGKTGHVAVTETIGAIIALACAVAFIPSFGLFGAVVAVIIGYGVQLAWVMSYSRMSLNVGDPK